MHVHTSDLRLLRDLGFSMSSRKELLDMLGGIFHQDKNRQHIEHLVDFVIGSRSDVPTIEAEGTDSLYLANIVGMCSPQPSLLHASPIYDFLAEAGPEWTLLQTISHLALCNIKPDKKLAIVTSARNEGIHLLEWIAHYRSLGVDSIYIYTNDNNDGSDALLLVLSAIGVINLIFNETQLRARVIQNKVYNHAISFSPSLWKHERLMFVDIDEMLIPLMEPHDAKSLIDQIEAANPDLSGVCFNWKWFASDAQMRRIPGLMLEKFKNSAPSDHVKTIVKLRDVTGARTPHMPRLIYGGTLADSKLNVIDNPMNAVTPCYGLGQVNHYWNKSFEEYLAKTARGNSADGDKFFFQWGNMGGDRASLDPVPLPLVERMKLELSRMMSIPEIAECMSRINQSFEQQIASYETEFGIEKRYNEAKAVAFAR